MTVKRLVRNALLFILLCFGQNAFSQSAKLDSLKSIKIFVLDSASQVPLENCTLVINDRESKQLFVGTSSATGMLDIKVDLSKAYKYRFFLVGYRTKERNLDFSKRVLANIGLVAMNNMLKEITVSGAIVTRDADKLSYRVNARKFLKGSDATVVLRDVPLVNINAKGDVEVKHNGATVLVNGLPMNSSQLRTIPADRIATVDVITNPSSTSSASSKEAIISIKLKESDVPSISGSITLLAGTLRRYLFPGLALNANSKKVYVSFNASLQSIEQENSSQTLSFQTETGALRSSQSTIGQAGYNGKNFSLRSFYNPGKSTQLSIGLAYATTKISSNSTGSDSFISPAISYNNTNFYTQPGSTFSVNTEYSTKFKDKSAVVFNYLYQHRTSQKESEFVSNSSQNTSFRSNFNDDIRSDANTIQASYSKNFLKDELKTEFGGFFSDRRSETDNNSTLRTFAGTESVATTIDYISLNQQSSAAFMTLRYKIKGYSFRLGSRYEHLDQHYQNRNSNFKVGYDNLFPNFVVQKKILKNLDMIFNYQRKISRPDISILNPNLFQYSNIESYEGNQFIRPELVNKYDINLDFKTEKTFFELGLYTNYTKNPIIYLAQSNNSSITYRYENAKNLLVSGVDLSVKTNLSEKLSLNGGLFAESYSYSEELGKSANADGNNIGGNLGLYYRIPQALSTSLDVSYKKNPEYSYQSYQKAYPTMNASVSRNFFKNKFLASVIYNDIFNTSSRNRSYYDDTYLSQMRIIRGRTNNLVIQLSYSFGKQFYSGKAQNKVATDEEKSFQKL